LFDHLDPKASFKKSRGNNSMERSLLMELEIPVSRRIMAGASSSNKAGADSFSFPPESQNEARETRWGVFLSINGFSGRRA